MPKHSDYILLVPSANPGRTSEVHSFYPTSSEAIDAGYALAKDSSWGPYGWSVLQWRDYTP